MQNNCQFSFNRELLCEDFHPTNPQAGYSLYFIIVEFLLHHIWPVNFDGAVFEFEGPGDVLL